MVQIKRSQLLDRNLTGASFISDLGFYDETANYASGVIVSWKNKKYESLNSITGTTEGNLTHAPDLITTDWKEIVNASSSSFFYSVYPSASQAFTSTRITINFNTERMSDSSFSISSGELTFLKSGTYFISVTTSVEVSSSGWFSSISGAKAYVQLNTGSGYSDISNIVLVMYAKAAAASMTFPLTVTAGHKIRIQIARYDGSDTISTIPNGCNISIW